MLRTPVTHEFRPQFLHDLIQHRKRPTPLEHPLRRLIVRRLALVALFASREFERDNGPTAPLLGPLTVFLVSDKETSGKSTEMIGIGPFRVGAVEIAPFQYSNEEVLREVVRLISSVAAAAQIGRTTDTSSSRTKRPELIGLPSDGDRRRRPPWSTAWSETGMIPVVCAWSVVTFRYTT